MKPGRRATAKLSAVTCVLAFTVFSWIGGGGAVADRPASPQDATFDARLAGLFAQTSREDGRFTLDAPRAQVYEYAWESTQVPTGLLSVTQRESVTSWHATNLSLVSRVAWGQDGGFVALTRTDGPTRLHVRDGVGWEPRLHSRLGNRDGSDSPHNPWYARQVSGPHFMATSAATMQVEGTGGLKVYGHMVEMHSDQNTTWHETGARVEAPGQLHHRWIYIEFENAVLRIESNTPVQIAAFELRTAPHPGQPPAILAPAGPFDGIDETLGMTALRIIVLTGVAAAGTVAAAAAGHRTGRGSRRERLHRALENARLADRARDHQTALRWYAKASKLAPHDPKILMDQAWALATEGHIPEALANYERASTLLPPNDGSANLAAALLHHEHTHDGSATAREIHAALARDPHLLIEIEAEENLYRALQGNPVFDAAIARAMLQLESTGE